MSPRMWFAQLPHFFLVGWLFFFINVDLAIFQPYLDLEAGDNQSLKIQVARRGIEPRSSCSTSQELNHSATAAPPPPPHFFLTVVIGNWIEKHKQGSMKEKWYQFKFHSAYRPT